MERRAEARYMFRSAAAVASQPGSATPNAPKPLTHGLNTKTNDGGAFGGAAIVGCGGLVVCGGDLSGDGYFVAVGVDEFAVFAVVSVLEALEDFGGDDASGAGGEH